MKKFILTLAYISISTLIGISQVNLDPPTNLQTVVNGNDVQLTWNAPDTTNALFFSWDNGITGNALGYPDSGSYAVAGRWDEAILEEYSEYSISKVGFYLPGANSIINARIWDGSNADTVIFSQSDVEGNPSDWSLITPSMSIPVEDLTDLWVGYEVIQLGPDFPAGMDDGLPVVGYGDMINTDGSWVSLTQTYGIGYNFNVRVYLVDSEGDEIVLGPVKTAAVFDYSNNLSPEVAVSGSSLTPSIENSLSEPMGYQVYRNDELITPDPIADLFFLDPTVSLGVYTYAVTAVYEEGESLPVTVNVQIGSPEMVILPEFIDKTVNLGSVSEEILTIYNEGDIDLYWNAVPQDYFLYMNPPTGILAPGEGFDVQLLIFTYGLVAGTYESEILFYQNNPENPADTIPVTITAVGSPGISTSPASINFGDVSLGSNPFFVLNIWNTGLDTLIISEIISSSPLFTFDEIPEAIPPSGQDQMTIQLDASVLGEVSETLSIFSNDVTQPQLDVPMMASVALQAPILLQANVSGNDVALTWDMPDNNEGTWLQWDDGVNYSAIGYTNGGSFQYAARWEPTQLANFAGSTVNHVLFFPRGVNSNYTLKIWKGINASVPVVAQPINGFQVDQWNEVFLQDPFQLDDTEELWVGFEVSHPTGDFPAGHDNGPAIAFNGDMINTDGSWESASFLYGLDNNWNIQVFLQEGDSSYKLATKYGQEEPIKEFYNKGELVDGNLPVSIFSEFQPFDYISDVLGYNIFRNDTLLNNILLSEQSYLDEGLPFGLYDYGVTAVYPEGESPKTTQMVQVGAPVLEIEPGSVSDTLENGESKEYILILENTGNFVLDWNANSGSSWLSISQFNGSIDPGEQTELVLTLNSSALFAGIYQSSIIFELNNLNDPVFTYPVQMVVTGEGMLVITPDSIDFGMTAVGTTKTDYATLTNSGNDYIIINEMNASPDIFSTQSFPLFLYPGGVVSFPVYFSPETPGTFMGELTISTGDSVNQNLMTYTLPLEGNSLLPPPVNLTAEADSNNVLIDWFSPVGGMGDFLQYSADNSATAIGYGGGGTFIAATKFGPEELMAFNGTEITQIGFIPWTANADFTVKLWIGENADELLLSQPVGVVTPLEWNDVFLGFSVPVDTATTMWIGYEVTHEDGEFPAGVDFGPAISGKGNLLSNDGSSWITLNYYGLDYNWNIRGVTDQGKKSMASGSFTPYIQKTFANRGRIKAAFLPTLQAPLKAAPGALDLYGYNVYRNGEIVNGNTLITQSEYQDGPLVSGLYSYEVTAVYDLGESLPSSPIEILIETGNNAPEGWQHHQTSMTHVVHVPTNAAESGFMSPGDWIGVFYEDDGILKCGGALEWADTDSLKLIVYGDNPATGLKEGFSTGEWLNWKVFMTGSEQEFNIQVDYNPFMPNYDGYFSMLGESALSSMQITTTRVGTNDNSSVLLYPNPASTTFTLTGLNDYSTITIRNAMGTTVYDGRLSGQDRVRLSPELPAGMYTIIVEGKASRITKKLLIR